MILAWRRRTRAGGALSTATSRAMPRCSTSSSAFPTKPMRAARRTRRRLRRLLPGRAGAPQLRRGRAGRTCGGVGAGRDSRLLSNAFRSRGRILMVFRRGGNVSVRDRAAVGVHWRGTISTGTAMTVTNAAARACPASSVAHRSSRAGHRCGRNLGRRRAGQGHARAEAAAAARQSRRSQDSRPRNCSAAAHTPAPLQARIHRLLCQGLSRRRRRAADQRQDLAGDAAVAQSQLGPSGRWWRSSNSSPSKAPRSAGAGSWSATSRSRAADRC